MLIRRLLGPLFVFIGLAVGLWFNPSVKEWRVSRFTENIYNPAVALLYTGDETKKFDCTATAFSLDRNGYLFLTAAHCVNSVHGPYFLSPDGDNPQLYYPATLVAYGEENQGYDFAILHIIAKEGSFTTVRLGHNPSKMGEKVLAISAPNGVGKSLTTGSIALPFIHHSLIAESIEWKGNFLFSASGEGHGSSGSAVICEDQMQACGVMIGIHDGGLYVAEPIERFKYWWPAVQRGDIQYFPPESEDFK